MEHQARGTTLHVRGAISDDRARLALRGEIDLASADAIRAAVSEALDGGARDVVLDLAGVSLLDSTGLSELLKSSRDVQRRGGALRCEAPHGSEARLVIELTGLAGLLGLSEPDGAA